ncbi:MAG: YbhB/YbcL family Raf kinase inhibitor-like protein [Planctomycetaceae bacterium]|nr:YbhB/YbcL family Raf kinase inhibitor-like protein [Planctomycetaceae bacterium]
MKPSAKVAMAAACLVVAGGALTLAQMTPPGRQAPGVPQPGVQQPGVQQPVLAPLRQAPLTRPATTTAPAPARMSLMLASDALGEGQLMDRRHSFAGGNVSPPLSWSGLPEGTHELVVMLEAPDSPAGNLSHWLVYGIKPELKALPEKVAASPRPGNVRGAMQGRNSFDRLGYSGPLPSVGGGPERYQFRVFALNRRLGLQPGLYKEQVQKEMFGHVIAQGVLTVTYERPAR